MSDIGNWSNDSQAHTRICVLESQVDVKDKEHRISEECNEKFNISDSL